MQFDRYHIFTCETPLRNKAKIRGKGQAIATKFGDILLFVIYCNMFRFLFRKHPSGIDTILAEKMCLH
jgi:hypothetical protein